MNHFPLKSTLRNRFSNCLHSTNKEKYQSTKESLVKQTEEEEEEEEMADPANVTLLPHHSSPTASSISSSDLDTESTGSFFPDRSTTLGTLMGVSFPAITFQSTQAEFAAAGGGPVGRRSKKKNNKPPLAARRRRRWWRLCREDGVRPASLGEFLEIERRFGDGAFFDGAPVAELRGGVDAQARNGRVLFEDGRVLPPNAANVNRTATTPVSALCRFQVSLTGICSGGTG